MKVQTAHSIFYDLETSDTEPLGQILNYCFMLVDDELMPIDECSGIIRISRLQLPRPQAILANRVNVLEHQREAKDNERKALQKIHQFFTDSIARVKQPLALVGYNSSKFDLPFLRTSFIRNGLNPFAWKGTLLDRDLFLAAKALYCRETDFPAPESANPKEPGAKRLSLKLESLGQAFGLLDAPQTHFSRDDVLLTIELARSFRELFDFNCEKYVAYEAARFERIKDPSSVLWVMEPNYDLTQANRFVTIPYAFLTATHSYALWLDLKRYAEGAGRQAIVGVSKSGGGLIVADEQVSAGDWAEVARRGRAEFAGLTVDTFFPETICDIEQHIWRLDFADRDALARSIADGDSKTLHSTDAKILFMRYVIAQYEWGSGEDKEMESRLQKYAMRRYGGEVILSKSAPQDPKDLKRHSTLKELLADLELCEKTADQKGKELLAALRGFYHDSDIMRVAGKELLTPLASTVSSAGETESKSA